MEEYAIKALMRNALTKGDMLRDNHARGLYWPYST